MKKECSLNSMKRSINVMFESFWVWEFELNWREIDQKWLEDRFWKHLEGSKQRKLNNYLMNQFILKSIWMIRSKNMHIWWSNQQMMKTMSECSIWILKNWLKCISSKWLNMQILFKPNQNKWKTKEMDGTDI